MWGLMDFETFVGKGLTIEDLCFDIAYCSIYSLFSLWISNILGNIVVKNKISRSRFAIHVVLLLTANFAWAIAFENIFDSLWHEGNDVYWDRIYIFGIIATLLTMINACLYYSSILIKKEKENVELYNNLLRLQTNPHFIFNSINTLADLIQENPVHAENFTLKFSETYRYVVSHMDDKTVPIHEEIHFVKNYCELQETSSPHSIHVEIAEDLKRCKDKTLPLAVQMMVENAIKHNCHTKESPLSIAIYRQNEYIIVRNVLNPIKSSLPTTHKGLANLRLRYKQLGKELIVSNDSKYFEVKLPIL
jgi:sensor histidine kinase YesM